MTFTRYRLIQETLHIRALARTEQLPILHAQPREETPRVGRRSIARVQDGSGFEVLISAARKSCFGHADVKFWHRFRESKRPQVGTEQTLLQRQHFWLPAASLRDEAIAPNGIPFLGCAGEVEGKTDLIMGSFIIRT